MIRSALSKVAWVGRTASMVFGLALVMALMLGAASVALAGNLDPLKIGSLKNVATKTTQLVGKVATGPAFVVKNYSGGSALDLQVQAGQEPLAVNSSVMVDNLHAEYLDGKTSNDFAPKAVEAWREVGASNQPAFTNGWTNFGDDHSTAAFYKDPWGVVHLKGVVQGGTVAHNPSGSVFTLPCGYGPSKDEVHSVLSNDTAGRVSIFFGPCGSGQYSAQVVAAPPSNAAWVSLDGITFRAAGS